MALPEQRATAQNRLEVCYVTKSCGWIALLYKAPLHNHPTQTRKMFLMQLLNQPMFCAILIQQCQLISVHYAATLTSNAQVENQTKENNLPSTENHVCAFLITSDTHF